MRGWLIKLFVKISWILLKITIKLSHNLSSLCLFYNWEWKFKSTSKDVAGTHLLNILYHIYISTLYDRYFTTYTFLSNNYQSQL